MLENLFRTLRRSSTTALLPLLLAGCGGHVKRVVDAPPRFGDPAAVITRVGVTPLEFHAGESVRIEVSMVNPTALPIVLHFTSGCVLSFAVKDSRDTFVAPKGIVCTANAPTIELAPGEALTRLFPWDGTDGYPGTPLPPGDYRVIGGLDSGALRQPSAPVSIRILAP